MVVVNLSRYFDRKDKNGVAVREWASQKFDGVARCKFCDCDVKFSRGLLQLMQHSESAKHKKNNPMGNVRNETIPEFLERGQSEEIKKAEINQQAEDLTIKLVRHAAVHDHPFESLECLVKILKDSVGDSEVLQAVKLSETKARYVAKHGLALSYHDETVRLINESDAISVGWDESEIMKRSQGEIVVKMAHPEKGILTRHLVTKELDRADAEYLSGVLLDTFMEEGISLDDLLISMETDGCNTMAGHKNGVQKRISEQVHQVQPLKTCTDHHLCNSEKHATTAFDNDMEQALVNLYEDIAGAKGRSQKSRHLFKEAAKRVGIKPVAVAEMSTTRFRGIRHCVSSALKNFPAIKEYYTSLKKLTPRQVKIYLL